MTILMTESQVKASAKKLTSVVAEKHEIKLQHGHALDLVSMALGFRDWNTLSASLKKERGEK